MNCPICGGLATTKRGLKKHLMGKKKFNGHGKSEIEVENIINNILDDHQTEPETSSKSSVSPTNNNEILKYIGTIPKESGIKKRIRFHQGWWRAFVLNEPQGKNPVNQSEEVCNTILSGETSGKNFLTPATIKSVWDTIDERKYYAAGLLNESRLFNNLLSSQPLAFNFFGELKQNLNFAKTIITSFIPRLTDITGVLFEYAPKDNYLEDNSAFDVAIEIIVEGKKGLFGLECKYTDSFSEKEYSNDKYEAIFQGSSIFSKPYENYINSRFNQIFRNQLIAESLLQHKKYDFVHTGLFCYQGDEEAINTGKAFQDMLKNGSELFKIITYSEYLTAIQKLNLTPEQREWTILLWARYCGLTLSDYFYKIFLQ